MGIDLPLIWAIIIGFGLMRYIIMDGLILGSAFWSRLFTTCMTAT
jgi:cytochrome bd-type quinol oxidase subunit 2